MKIINRHYGREYREIERLEVGVQLSGGEAKSLFTGHAKLEQAYVKILGNEAFLINAEIPQYRFASDPTYQPTRKRKLLLHSKELERLKIKLQSSKGLTIVPIECYNKVRRIKVLIGLVTGRGEIGKKNLEKEQTVQRNQQKEMKEYMKK